MTQSEVTVQAKAGNPAAIAALLNRTLQPRGITSTTQLDGFCLTIELTAAHPIPQASAIAFIQRGMNQLKPKGIESVLVSARHPDHSDLDWLESFLLDGVATSPVAQRWQPAPPADLSVPEAVRSAAHSPESATIPAPQTNGRSPRPAHSPDSATIPAPQTNEPAPRPTTPRSRRPIPTRAPVPPTNRNTAKGVEALIIGLILAGVLFKLAFLKLLFAGAIVLVHEVGHAVTFWAFGYPAIPTVNILYGGGVTLTFGQVGLIIGLIYAGIAYLFYRSRQYPKVLGILAVLTLIYTYCLLTPTHMMLSTFMGHGMELVAIALCLYMAATGRLCRIPGDRVIYAMLGFFIFFYDVEFCWQILHDSDYREWYEGGIGGVMDSDFVILANDYFHTHLSHLISIFLLSCFLAVAIGLGSAYLIPTQKTNRS